MGTYNIRFYGEISKITPLLSPNTLLTCICSTILPFNGMVKALLRPTRM